MNRAQVLKSCVEQVIAQAGEECKAEQRLYQSRNYSKASLSRSKQSFGLCPRQEDEAKDVPLSTNRGDQEQLTTKIATVANCRRVDRGVARETVQDLPQEQQRPPGNLEKLIDC